MKYALSNLLGGVSQKEREERADNQLLASDNWKPSPEEDLTPRTPFQLLHKASLGASPFGDTFRTSDGEAHAVLVDSAGTVIIVDPYKGGARVSPGTLTYLASSNPTEDIRAAQIADSILLVNRTQQPTITVGTPPSTDSGRIIRVDSGFEGVAYEVTAGDETVGVTAGAFDGADSVASGLTCEANGYYKWEFNTGNNDVLTIKYNGDVVAEAVDPGAVNNEQKTVLSVVGQLNSSNTGVLGRYLDLESNPDGTVTIQTTVSGSLTAYTNITVELNGVPLTPIDFPPRFSNPVTTRGSYIRIIDGLTVTTSDGLGGTGLELTGDEVDSIEDLPQNAFDGRVVRVSTKGDTPDQYFVFEAEDATAELGVGSWRETTEDNAPVTFTTSTMPVLLVWDGTNWSLNTPNWAPKPSNVNVPSFIQNSTRIEDVDYYQGRVCFLSGNYLFAGRAGRDLFNLWQNSPAEVLPTDPIDVTASSADTGFLRYFQQVNGYLMCWGSTGIAAVYRERPFTPEGVALGTYASVHTLPSLPPATRGAFSMFLAQGSTGTMPYVYVLDKDPERLLPHAPTYLPKDITWWAASSTEDWAIFGDSAGGLYGHLLNPALELNAVFGLSTSLTLTGGAWLGDLFVGWGPTGVYRSDFGGYSQDPALTAVSSPSGRLSLLDVPVVLSGATSAYTALSDPRDGSVTRSSNTYTYARSLVGSTTEFTFSSSPWGVGDDLVAVVAEVGTSTAVTEGQILGTSWNGSKLTVDADVTASGVVLLVGIRYSGTFTAEPPILRRQGGTPLTSGTYKVKKCTANIRRGALLQATKTVKETGRENTKTWEHPYHLTDELTFKKANWDVPVGRNGESFTLSFSFEGPHGASVQRLVWDMTYKDR